METQEADGISWVGSLARIGTESDIAERLSLVFVFGPGHLARQGLKQASEAVHGRRRTLWHRLDVRGADLTESLAMARDEPVVLLVHGLEFVEPERRRELVVELNTGRNALRSFDAFVIFWLPESEREDLFRFCPDLLQWRTLVATVTAKEVESYRPDKYDVFLSHASGDKSEVENLARRLRDKEGIVPFLDEWHLVPGEPWQEALERALEASRACAVFVGREVGPWQNREMRAALTRQVRDQELRVIPVLLPGAPDPEELPLFLEQFGAVDFRAGIDDEDAYHRFLCGIRGIPPGAGDRPPSAPYRAKLPPRDFFVHRRELDQVRDLLTGPAGSTVGVTGMGGIGKTALARALCDDPDVRAAYPDGILWTTMGEQLRDADRVDRVLDLVRWWTGKEPPGFKSARDAGDFLKKVLAGKRVLVVVDDAWRTADLEPFRSLDPGTVLETTRNVPAIPVDARRFDVDAMATAEAVELLAHGLPSMDAGRLGALARRLGEWPLLLRLVRSQLLYFVREKGLDISTALDRVESKLVKAGLRVFDRRDATEREEAVSLTMNASLDVLSAEDRQRYLDLAVFPEDVDVPVRVVERLWGVEDWEAENLCRHLEDVSLLLDFDLTQGAIRLHDVIRQYLVEQHDDLPALHRRLLARCRPPNGGWTDLPKSETYLWRHLAHHLTVAGERAVLRRLLFDFDYLEGKLRTGGVNALLADYDTLGDTGEARTVQEALRLSAHVLARDWGEFLGQQLAGQLLGRLDGPGHLLKEASTRTSLRPSRPSLTTPGGPLLRTLEGHDFVVSAVAMIDKKNLVSVSRDKTVRLWDVATGEATRIYEGPMPSCKSLAMIGGDRMMLASGNTLQICDLTSGTEILSFEGHADTINAFVMIDDNRVVSASRDETLRVWNIHTGKTLQILRTYIQPHDRMGATSFLPHGNIQRPATRVNYRMPMTAVARLDANHVVAARVTSASEESELLVWELSQGNMVHSFGKHAGKINAIAVIDQEREQMISASDDKTLRVWNWTTGENVQTLEGHRGPVLDVMVLGKNSVVSTSYDQTLRVWHLDTGKTVVLSGHTRGVNAVARVDDHLVASAAGDNTVCIWDIRRDELSSTLARHDHAVRAFAVVDNVHAVSASADKTLRLWNIDTCEPVRTLSGHTEHVDAVAVIDRNRVISASGDGTLQVWDLRTGQSTRTIECRAGWISHSVAVIDEHRAVSAAESHLLRVWDLDSGRSLSTLEGHNGRVQAVAVAGNRVVSGFEDHTLRIWDLTNGETLHVLEGHSGDVYAVAVIDAQRVISASQDQTLRVWDVTTGETLRILEGHSGGVHAVAVVSRSRAVSASNDHTVRVWDLERGQMVAIFTLDAPALSVAAAAKGRKLLAGDQRGGVHFLDLDPS